MGFFGKTMNCRSVLRRIPLCLKNERSCRQFSCRVCGFHHPRQSLERRYIGIYGIINSTTYIRFMHSGSRKDHSENVETATNATFVGHRKLLKDERHHALMSDLQRCSTVQEQMNRLCSEVGLSKEDVEKREKFVKSLHNILLPFFPNMQLTLFGSSVNGLGLEGCDCDISIDICGRNDGESREVKELDAVNLDPTLAEVKSGKISLTDVASFPPKVQLRFIRSVFKEYCQHIRGSIVLRGNRHPVLNFFNKEYNLRCDFSCGNKESFMNNHVIRLLIRLDERVLPLLKILRYWAKHHELIRGVDSLNSYGLSLLAVYFLQKLNPPVLPPISLVMEKSGHLLTGDIEENELVHNELKNFAPSENTLTVEELLREFFFYYLYFDFSQVICPLTASCVPKWEYKAQEKDFVLSAVVIQDPFVFSHNISHAATDVSCRHFLKCVLKACQSYQESEMCIPNLDKPWGLMPLLDNSCDSKKPQKDVVHAIEIPLEAVTMTKPLENDLDLDDAQETWFQKATRAVINVFEYGLLFKCKQRTDNGVGALTSGWPTGKVGICREFDMKKCAKSVRKISCTAYNVFSGRTNLQELSAPHDAANCFLEKERMISLSIFERKSENEERTLCNFECECVELEKDVPALIIFLKFPKDNYKGPVAVFLKEYLPRFVQQSL